MNRHILSGPSWPVTLILPSSLFRRTTSTVDLTPFLDLRGFQFRSSTLRYPRHSEWSSSNQNTPIVGPNTNTDIRCMMSPMPLHIHKNIGTLLSFLSSRFTSIFRYYGFTPLFTWRDLTHLPSYPTVVWISEVKGQKRVMIDTSQVTHWLKRFWEVLSQKEWIFYLYLDATR